MANLKEIRNRIASVSSTMQITSAMKMVSAAKLKKAQDAITAMTEVMTHRGPDEHGYYQDDDIALGQRRLSIVGLSSGRQPISNA